MNIYLDGLPPVHYILSGHLKRQYRNALTQMNLPFTIYDFNNENTLINHFRTILALEATNNNCTITFCCHGHEHDGLIFHNEEERMSLVELKQYLTDFKQRFPNLIIILNVCHCAFIGNVIVGNPFVFGYTFKIPMQAAMDSAIGIITDF